MQDIIKKVRGVVEVLHYDEYMNLIERREFENLVVTTGLNWITDRLNDPVPAVMTHIAVGSSNAVPTMSQTILTSEVARVAVTTSGGATSNNNLVFAATLLPGTGTGSLQEAGIFNSAAGGTMLSRVTYPVINKAAGDTIAINWTITVG